MAYQALYRVFRPQKFSDVVGQEHITKTLQNALLQQKFSHAYLFSGPRGTGKTSAAKILAKAVNCEHAPVAEPCNECAACKGITDGSISDCLEIDAASNNGVDEIRDIRDKVKYAPSAVKYKVYIIDEVHMLSIGAFNALLKTLEEPPKHVIFILATTEPHKIPLTIISRCQRFDFKRITGESIVGRLATVLEAQGIESDPQALSIIARAAEGGMRDALSLMDQAISFSEGSLTVQDALAITGSVSQTFMTDMVKGLYEKNVAMALDSLHQIFQSGKDPARFLEDFIFYYRDMLLYKTAPNLEQILDRVQVDDAFQHFAQEMPVEAIYETIDILNKSQQEMKWTNHPRIFLEVAIVKLCQTEGSTQEAANQDQVNLLQKKITLLENKVKELASRSSGEGAKSPQSAKGPARTSGGARSGFKPATGRIQEVLKQATRSDLDSIKGSWAQLLDTLRKQSKVSHAALLTDSEPVAASNGAFVLKFKYEIHCKMASDEPVKQNLEQIILELTGKSFEMLAVPEQEWLHIREGFIRGQKSEDEGNKEEDDPFIQEAKKLVGPDLIEIKE
ncbi:DNA polymerase III subunit gamma/tau [Sutcliffiella rhizosphaerae]|uniref:DNA-directed DNA polymerase n=1 Tax=Sutcliffiella rhizosphaerae TaxID=2880967 RepID=A0ABN8AE44_9BACI|nr:DNA polymerase III subunit gamma/tau [Sutcliffiella rhizosphaerae]CAG9623550.1 Holliday junction ATP-dependent DNA helicase RuvB [Sutcliffiella rhizosphaerae]